MKQCSHWSAVSSFSCIRSIRSCRWLISMAEDVFAVFEQKSSVMSPNGAVSMKEKSTDTIEMHMCTHCSTYWWKWSVGYKEFEHNPREIPAQPHCGLDRRVEMDHLHPKCIKGVFSFAKRSTNSDLMEENESMLDARLFSWSSWHGSIHAHETRTCSFCS